MQNRRSTKRRSISYYLRIIDSESKKLIGHLADITLQGLKIDSQAQLPVNKNYRLRINTTTDVAEKDYIEFEACTKWCKIDPIQPGIFNVGFEIILIDPTDADIIQRIVNKYSRPDNTYSSYS
jgi:hypothetical protein